MLKFLGLKRFRVLQVEGANGFGVLKVMGVQFLI
jgi:hypothetical protein